LNALVGRRLARISATPGKTKMMSVYVVSGRWPVAGAPPPAPSDHQPPTTGHSFYLLDLPGYGYSRASKTDRTAFAHLVRHVLHRPRLAGIVWLLDARHEPSASDREMQDLLAAAGTGVLAAVTKGDKLPRGRQSEREAALRQALTLDLDQVVLTSARTGLGIPDLREAITTLAAGG
jgi:GTP-binding protein